MWPISRAIADSVRHARKSERMTGLGSLDIVQLISVEVQITRIIIINNQAVYLFFRRLNHFLDDTGFLKSFSQLTHVMIIGAASLLKGDRFN